MEIQEVPKLYLDQKNEDVELFVYDFKMSDDVVKQKVNLTLHMFSFLQTGKKEIHFTDTSVEVNVSQSILIKKGNSLWTELIDKESSYFCRLLFFSDDMIKKFLSENNYSLKSKKDKQPFFIIENDDFIMAYLNSLSSMNLSFYNANDQLLKVKFNELIIYLIAKYGDKFVQYLFSLISEISSPFITVIEKNVYSNLKLEEIAFLCNMSLSTFKRHFKSEFGVSPGKWFQDKRLLKAKELLEKANKKPTDIHEGLGYTNLSNFSAAYKNKFGKYPSEK